MVRWAKGFQLKPNHRQLGHRKLYVYEPQVYCTFTREFTSGHGLMRTVMVTLGSRYSLQCFASCFDILAHLDLPKFYSRPAACIRRPKFLFDLPSWWFAQVFFANAIFLLIRQSFTLPKFRAIRYYSCIGQSYRNASNHLCPLIYKILVMIFQQCISVIDVTIWRIHFMNYWGHDYYTTSLYCSNIIVFYRLVLVYMC